MSNAPSNTQKSQSNPAPAGGSTYRTPTLAAPSISDTGDFEQMVGSIAESVKDYGSKHPLAVAGSIFALGFYLGWKIKPW